MTHIADYYNCASILDERNSLIYTTTNANGTIRHHLESLGRHVSCSFYSGIKSNKLQ